jgi:hypothetical protein
MCTDFNPQSTERQERKTKMKSFKILIPVVLSVIFWGSFNGCVTDTASLKVEKTLPQGKLVYYSDSFDELRTDLWEKAGYAHNKAQEANFKLANAEIKDGRLRVKTETGCFSEGGLGTKFAFKGDFDVQIDCKIDFVGGVHDMDQLLVFVALGKEKEIEKSDTVSLGLLKKGGRDFSIIFSAIRENGRLHPGKWHKTGSFDGSLRILRIGDELSTLFKKKGDAGWKKIDTCRFTPREIMLGFKLQNFVLNRTSITAKSPITATFDNFRINAAEEIIEEEI